MKRHGPAPSIAPKWSQEKKLKESKIDQATYYIDMIKFMIQLLENGAGNFLPSPTASFAYQAHVCFGAWALAGRPRQVGPHLPLQPKVPTCNT